MYQLCQLFLKGDVLYAVCTIEYGQQYLWKSMDYNLNIQKYEINYNFATPTAMEIDPTENK